MSQPTETETKVGAAKPMKTPCPKIEKQSSKPEKTDHQPTRSAKSAETDNITRISVKPETLSFFSRMFSEPKATLGMTPWKDLVGALVDAGFSAICRGGSAVTFKHKLAVKGGIVFHRPHPDSKIAPSLLKGMGKRLTDWFGWSEDTFVGRSK